MDQGLQTEALMEAIKVLLVQAVIKDSEETQEGTEADTTLRIEPMTTSTSGHKTEAEAAEEAVEVHQICTQVLQHDTTTMGHLMATNMTIIPLMVDHTLTNDTEAMILNPCTLKATGMEACLTVLHQEMIEEGPILIIHPLEVAEMEEDAQDHQVAHHQGMDQDLASMKEALAQEAQTNLQQEVAEVGLLLEEVDEMTDLTMTTKADVTQSTETWNQSEF
jgi:hypothetical protein